MKILVTGGAGYIGSHTIIELAKEGHDVIVVDNLSNSTKESLSRVEKIAGIPIPFYEIDVRHKKNLDGVFSNHDIDAVIHFAGLKSINESVQRPINYYDNNIVSTLKLLNKMKKYAVKKLVFSSSAAVYGIPSELPVSEESRVGIGISNPYGKTKYMIEQILNDTAKADPLLEISILRYFNPIGAHSSGLIGESHSGTPNNLLPYISQVAVGKLKKVNVFGDDYDTHDGTGVRDYIHVVDLARGHVAALKKIKPGVSVYNLGTGKGTSVLELIDAFRKVSGKKIPHQISSRRPADVASCYASAEKAARELEWMAKKTIEEACADAWRWQSQNPDGLNHKD